MKFNKAIKAVLAGTVMTAAYVTSAAAQQGDWVIALSNAYYGNTWRHQMVEAFEDAASEAKEKGMISEFIVMNGDGSVAAQNSAIGELILRGVNMIAVNAASETAVNGVIEQACAAGIIVVSFDSVASAPCNSQLNFDFKGYKMAQARAALDLIEGKGNIIQVRGVAGSAPDEAMFAAQNEVLKDYPDINVAAVVVGQATASVAQAAITNVLPSLPHIDAVLAQGGSDDVGIAQAFSQYGGDYVGNMPVIEGGGGTDFVKWWVAENKENGYQTVSMNTTPGIGGAVFWLGLAMLNGGEAPNKMIMPVATVDAGNLEAYSDLPSGRIISPSYSPEWVEENLLIKSN